MKVICTKCGGMHVACEAMINPNDKSFRNYTDEAFIYGWCDDCGYGVVLSDVDEVKTDIVLNMRKNRFMRNVKSCGKMKVSPSHSL